MSATPVAPGVTMVRQDNPGPMTLDGTNTWIVHGSVVIDPGEDSEQHPAGPHLDALETAAPNLALVVITHRHHDHSGAAAALHERSGVPVRALDPQHCHGAGPLHDGETLDVAGATLRVLATPGHTSDSVCFVLDDGADGAAVLTGDTILGRGTTVVAHPDGALGPYLDSLRALRGLGGLPVWPGHGPVLPAVDAVAREYLEHRAQRLAQIRAALERLGGDASAAQVVADVYADVDESVRWAAELSVRAQLDYLRAADGSGGG